MGGSSINLNELSLQSAPKTDKFVGLKGADIFHELMREHGVEKIFGYPGGAILPVYDSIHESPYFDFILSRFEQGAGHMADGYSRVTGKPGVVLVTSGPGATNTVTALANAQMDSIPIVVFSGQVATTAIGNDAFQEADVTGIVRPCTKWTVLVKDVRDLARRINEAFYVATSGRPGPVLVDLPKDVTSATLREPCLVEPHKPGYEWPKRASEPVLVEAAEMINKARKPILYVGGGVISAGASDLIRELAIKANIPVTTTLMGMGTFDELHPLSLHMLGMHGSAYANYAMQDADCVICVGARFDDRVTGKLDSFLPAAKAAARRGEGGVIHFDIDPSNINKNVIVNIAVEGDAKANLQAMMPMIETKTHDDWLSLVSDWKEKFPFTWDPTGSAIKPQSVVAEVYRQTKGEAVIATGVGQHQMWAAQHYRWRYPRQLVTSGGLGTMGFGVPAAIGAAAGVNDGRQVINFDGDGSFLMTGMEMVTAAIYNLPVKTIVLNNDFQGMVKQWQDLFFQKRYSGTPMTNPSFSQLGEAMGVKGLFCDDQKDVAKTVDAMLEHDGPVLAEFKVDKEEHVYPMVAVGRAINEMILPPGQQPLS